MRVKLTRFPELNRRVYQILCRELGVPDAVRFFSQLGLGGGDYVEERRGLFADLTLASYRKAVNANSTTRASSVEKRNKKS